MTLKLAWANNAYARVDCQSFCARWKNYDQAAQLARESALMADEQLERDKKKTLEDSRRVIRRFRLEGNAFYEQYKFREALVAYNEIEMRFSMRKLTKEDLIEEWADIKISLGIVKTEIGYRVEGPESPNFLSESVLEFRQALTVYKKDQLPQQWAMTQNNLGIALRSQSEWAGAAEGVRLLDETVRAFREALKMYKGFV